MKKYNIFILLLIPFIVALLGVITIKVSFVSIDNDMTAIDWKYNDVEAFKVSDAPYKLEATGVNKANIPLAEGNNLIWTVENKDKSIEKSLARILVDGTSSYLIAEGEGEVIITCANEKGTVFRRMEAVLYNLGAIIIQPKVSGSQNQIDDTIYYGMYDLNNNEKVNASFDVEFKIVPETNENKITLESKTDNINVSLTEGTVDILSPGEASFTISSAMDGIKSMTYSFYIVDGGVNVYTYDDLMNCTNKSEYGEIVVLRKSFESLDNTYTLNSSGEIAQGNNGPIKKANNVELFGKYNGSEFDFSNDVYKFETTFNDSYIRQWNEFADKNKGYSKLSNLVNAGIRVQRDFYGNGYTLNLHNLTYPYDYEDRTDSNGNPIKNPVLAKNNIFRGPLPFYSLGDQTTKPLVTAYGQDNIGFYVDGNNITVNDVNVKNCDFGNILSNLDYTGTVIEVSGNDNTIKNSRFQNGKNILRSFSSKNLLIDRCMLSTSRNFLVETGSNEYLPINDTKTYNINGSNITLKEALQAGGVGDTILNNFLSGEYENNEMKKQLGFLQEALNYSDTLEVKGTMEIRDSIMYRSGISSIAIENLFNGPFLYSASPSSVSQILSYVDANYLMLPKNVSGISYPVTVDLTGSTSFFDYKTLEKTDISGLIDENISEVATQFLGEEKAVTIDDIFPLKTMLYNKCSSKATYQGHVNMPVAFYGGGQNLSTVNIENLDCKDKIVRDIEVNLVDSYINLKGGEGLTPLKNMMQKAVTTVIGFRPFNFYCMNNEGYLYNQTPNVLKLKDKAI